MVTNEEIRLITSVYGCQPNDFEVGRLGGETNRNFLVKFEDKDMVVRVPYENSEIVDRFIESRNILALLNSGNLAQILPVFRVYIHRGENVLSSNNGKKFYVPDGTMVTGYIDGMDLDTELLKDEEIQRELVKTLHTFHTSGIRFVNSYDPFEDEISRYKRIVNASKKLSELVNRDTVKAVDEISRELEDKLANEPPISTHNDLVFGNLRVNNDGRVHLLDFEYAGYNIRSGLHYDFGTLYAENIFSDVPINKGIYERILEKSSKRYGIEFYPEKAYYGALVNIIVTFWWGLVKYLSSSNEEKDYYRKYIEKRIQGIKDISHFIKID